MFPPHLVLTESFHLEALRVTNSSGSSGDVFKTKLSNGKTVAVKQLRSSAGDHRKALVRAIREAHTWSLLQHPNIIALEGVASSSNITSGSQPATASLCLVSRWMTAGNVVQYLWETPWADRMAILIGIAEGVRYLHGLAPPVCHGDLKGNNVLISPNGVPLLTDFGLSSVMNSSKPSSGSAGSAGAAVNARWAPPERLFPEHYGMTSTSSRTQAGDVFSMFRTFLEILTDQMPFFGYVNEFYIANRVLAGVPPPLPPSGPWIRHLSRNLLELMLQAWSVQPSHRMTAAEALADLEFLSAIEDAPKRATEELTQWPADLLQAHARRSAAPNWGSMLIQELSQAKDVSAPPIARSVVNDATTTTNPFRATQTSPINLASRWLRRGPRSITNAQSSSTSDSATLPSLITDNSSYFSSTYPPEEASPKSRLLSSVKRTPGNLYRIIRK